MMNTADSQALPAPPSLIKALMAGFDAITNHLGLILFSVVLDLLLWFGPHWRIYDLVKGFVERAPQLAGGAEGDMGTVMRSSQQIWLELAEQFNFLSVLRSLPVGIPSLMSARSPLEAPAIAPGIWEIPSWPALVGLWLVLTFLGLSLGTLYFGLVAQASVMGKVDLRQALLGWPRATLHVALLALVWLVVLLVITLPFSCLLTFMVFAGLGVGDIGILFYGVLLAWVFFPLIFSPHGIFVRQAGVLASVRDGVRLTRKTFALTGMFLIILFVLSEGLDVLWRVPPETSWMSLVGIVGHAFVTTGLLAASFVYYCDADRWLKELQAKPVKA